jgi:HAD superfamily hydrolase (TIGR01509 family)
MDGPPLRAVIVDWDGTVLASFGAMRRATMAALADHGGSWSSARFGQLGHDWRGHYLAAGVRPDQLPAASRAYASAYRVERPRLRPHARQVLACLRARGLLLALVSSGVRVRIDAELLRTGLDRLFAVRVTYEDTLAPKPDPEPMLLALSRLGCMAGETVSIGDSPTDAQAARAAGIDHVTIRSPFAASRSDAVFADWRGVGAHLLTRINANRR